MCPSRKFMCCLVHFSTQVLRRTASSNTTSCGSSGLCEMNGFSCMHPQGFCRFCCVAMKLVAVLYGGPGKVVTGICSGSMTTLHLTCLRNLVLIWHTTQSGISPSERTCNCFPDSSYSSANLVTNIPNYAPHNYTNIPNFESYGFTNISNNVPYSHRTNLLC